MVHVSLSVTRVGRGRIASEYEKTCTPGIGGALFEMELACVDDDLTRNDTCRGGNLPVLARTAGAARFSLQIRIRRKGRSGILNMSMDILKREG